MKLKKIFILIALIVLFYTTYAFAAEPQIVIEGENTCRPNETKVLTVKITSETEIGVVSGKIEANENVANMTVTGKNNWNLTYNSETGVFNIYKAEGSKEEEIIDIEYEAGDIEGTATITISDIRMTTIAYETEEVSDITKEITIAAEGSIPDPTPTTGELSSISVTKAPNKTTYREGEKFDITGMEITAEYSDGTSRIVTSYTYTPNGELKTTDNKITISYTEGNITRTVEQNITVVNSSNGNNLTANDNNSGDVTPDKELPQTGTINIILIMLVAVIILSVSAYIGYRKYRKI